MSVLWMMIHRAAQTSPSLKEACGTVHLRPQHRAQESSACI